MLVHLIESKKFHYKLQAFYQRNEIRDLESQQSYLKKELFKKSYNRNIVHLLNIYHMIKSMIYRVQTLKKETNDTK